MLINPEYNWPVKEEMYPSGALLLLGTMLKQRGHTVKLVHMVADRVNVTRLVDIIKEFKPEMVGITMTTFQAKSARGISQAIKETAPDTIIIVGGTHVSALKRESLGADKHIDIAIVGEGEHIFVDIVEGGRYYSNLITAEREENLDFIPLPDLSLINIRKFKGSPPFGPHPGMFVMASRGCPFQCTFCSKSVFGNKVRYRKPEAVVDEIEYLHKDWGIREVFLQDDTFNLKRDWCEEILRGIIRRGLNRRTVFRAPCRANEKLVDLDLLKLMRQAGFWLIFYGVESGNQGMLDRMKKGLTLNEIRQAFNLTHEARIKTEAAFIVGLPGETEDTFGDTFEFCKELRPFWVGFSIATPFPGTSLFEEVREQVQDIRFEEYTPSAIYYSTDGLSKDDIRFHWWRANVYNKGRKLGELARHPQCAYWMARRLV